MSAIGVLLLAAVLYVQSEALNVHVVPHTHDDVGWLKTVDQYYYGANTIMQHAGVQYILDSVVKQLAKNENRTFIYVEMAFFMRWWREQTNNTKNLVKQLLDRGQLEFINGGWCMNDEATTDYNAIIDQMSLGLRFISNTFGSQYRPRVAWHIDPFGHSAEQASLFAMMGFDGFFFGRIDYDDKKHRLQSKRMEMVWRGSDSLGSSTDLFTGVLYNGYGFPGGFCFDQACADQPIMDDVNLFDYNVEERVDSFVKACKNQAQHYRTDNIMLTMGGDFGYENSIIDYKNIDKLMYYINKRHGSVNMFYSTPTRYLDTLHKSDLTWTLKTDDFFPYADCPWCFWTGYFTSRVGLKGYVRYLNGHLQTCRQLEAIHGMFPTMSPQRLAEAMGVAQHHDAVSGTEKQHVADDYAKRLHIGQVECEQLVQQSIGEMSRKSSSVAPLKLETCEYLNISVCPPTSGFLDSEFDVMVYNPLSRNDDHIVVRLPVSRKDIAVMDTGSNDVTCQVIPVSPSTKAVRRDRGKAPYELVFIAKAPPLGYNTYFVRHASREHHCVTSKIREHVNDEHVDVDNEYYKVTVDGKSGDVEKITNQMSGISVDVKQHFYWYASSNGANVNSSQASGAYIFRPNSSQVYNVNNNSNKTVISIVNGPVVQEVWQVFSSYVSQVIRLYTGTNHIEMEFTVGPIPLKNGKGKEIISRYDTNMVTNQEWFTDANGREMKSRVRNYRPTWQYNNTEPVSGNYYPVNSRIYMQDTSSNTQFTILTDRSQGGSSLKDGSLELMVHRRLITEDERGVGEPLLEFGQFGDGLIARGNHLLLVDKIENSGKLHRQLGERLLLPATILIHSGKESISEFSKNYNGMVSGLRRELPENVHLLTVQLLEKTSLLLRLEHMFAVKEDTNLSTSVTVNMKDLFVTFEIVSCVEMTLGGDVQLSMVNRLKWNIGTPSVLSDTTNPQVDPTTITLTPMMIRTFICDISYS
ncbi:lysosomal alpha-mannosidase-like isoform X1 [Dysidea avara]|uniref:lysosomal alpha-mannosidase-like isoform X1 n=1 Tax=Dysidea avara TaxID=196820 RepID=UPI00332EBC70